VSTFVSATASALARASPALVGLAVALHLLGLAMMGERWHAILTRMGAKMTRARAILVNLAGIFVRNVTPASGIGGDAVRIGLFRSAGAPLGDATVTLIYGRLLELPAISALVLTGLPAIGAAASRSRAALAVVLTLGTVLAVVAAARLPRGTRIGDWRERFGLARLPGHAVAIATFWATATWLETMIRLMVVSAALGVRLTVPQGAALTVFSIVGGLVPTIGGLGAIEGSLVTGLLLFGVPAGTATAITLVERAITYALSTALGGAALAAIGGWDAVRFVRRA
jgi:glycosyltransferase 2 family protein